MCVALPLLLWHPNTGLLCLQHFHWCCGTSAGVTVPECKFCCVCGTSAGVATPKRKLLCVPGTSVDVVMSAALPLVMWTRTQVLLFPRHYRW